VEEGGDAPCWAHLFEDAWEPTRDDLAGLVDRLADAVVIADREGRIVGWNEAATALFGWSAGEALGRTLDLIIPERLRARHWTGYRQVMATGHSDYGHRLLEVPAVHRDGRTISLAFTVTLMPAADGSVAGIAAVLRDDTARREELRALRRAGGAGGPAGAAGVSSP
jgi:PAS domain S-box-containing protein